MGRITCTSCLLSLCLYVYVCVSCLCRRLSGLTSENDHAKNEHAKNVRCQACTVSVLFSVGTWSRATKRKPSSSCLDEVVTTGQMLSFYLGDVVEQD